MGIGLMVGMIFLFRIHWGKEGAALVERVTGLHVPGSVRQVLAMRKRLDPNERYPYAFYATFKLSRGAYRHMVDSALIGRLDSGNALFGIRAGVVLKSNALFWRMDPILSIKPPVWWTVPGKPEVSCLYANLFRDGDKPAFGNVPGWNGRIVCCYREPDCFVYAECWSAVSGG